MRQIIAYGHPKVQRSGLSVGEHWCFWSSYLPQLFFFIALFLSPQGKIMFFRSSQVQRLWLLWLARCQALPQPAAQRLAGMQLQPEAGVVCPTTRTLQVPPEGRSGWLQVSIRELQWQLGVNLFLSTYCTVFCLWVAVLLFFASRWSPPLWEGTRAQQHRIYFPALDATQESTCSFSFSKGFSKFCSFLWEAFESVLLRGSQMFQGPPFSSLTRNLWTVLLKLFSFQMFWVNHRIIRNVTVGKIF